MTQRENAIAVGGSSIPTDGTGASFIGKVEINEGGRKVYGVENAASSAHDGAERQEVKLHAHAVAPSGRAMNEAVNLGHSGCLILRDVKKDACTVVADETNTL